MQVDFRVYLITDRRQAPGGDILRAVEGALDGGIRAVQLREKDLPGKELYLLADRMRELTARHGARLLINDRVDIALAVGADGVHLGGASMPASAARTLLGGEALIGCSTHSESELREAATQGADFATFGPVYPTPAKAAYGPPVGVTALAGACGRSAIPVFALGGVKAENTGEAIGAGAFGIALISGVVAAKDPRGAAMDLLTRVENALAIGKAAGEGNKGG
ncbi:MAG: thiamine phosphate synthase [Deltaproteobacteria bacterium]|nr:thiamine phosphate synthase [Deltaproteobacteria bacterium]MDH3383259.1 thiamine phosphate synthase [Deltaproteobacteria bacterium]